MPIRRVILGILAGALASAPAVAQPPAGTTTPTTPAASSAAVADTASAPAFEVASIRPANSNDGRHWYGTKLDPDRLTGSAVSLGSLVYYAYIGWGAGSDRARVSGTTGWMNSEVYDLEAKIDTEAIPGWNQMSDSAKNDIVRQMMKRLLAERFHLVLRTETAITPVYALVQVKGGAMLTSVDPPHKESVEEREKREREGMDWDKAPPGGYSMSDKGWLGNAIQIKAILNQIAHEIGATDKPIVDETGLTGYYSFSAKLHRDKDDPSNEQLIQEQLGLRIEQRKVPMTSYEIVSAVKPSEN